jgi:nitroreductase/dihydropteridine reductase
MESNNSNPTVFNALITTFAIMSIIEDLQWRYATKRYINQSVPEPQIETLLETIRLSATSLGMQPFEVYDIRSTEIREQMRLAASNQPQLTEASHVFVFAVWTHVTEEMVDAYLNFVAVTRNREISQLEGFRKSILGFLGNKTNEEIIKWSSNQAYIALGKAMVAAAQMRIDSTPMEGFNRSQVDDILDLRSKNLHASVILTVGYRDVENDPIVNAPKVRKPIHQIHRII